MKYLPLYIILALPLTGFSQDAPTAIIVEDEEPVESDSGSPAIEDEEVADNQDLDEPELGETSEDLNEPQQPAQPKDSTLPEPPEDLEIPEPDEEDEAVVVKVEIPKQIEVSEDSGFKLISPWAPKPMQQAPKGWRYIPAGQDTAYPVEVNLSTGKTLSLSITPYTLVPEISNKVIQVKEPGYQPEHGYQQEHSVSARLEKATDNLKQAGDSLDKSIENLSALVDSLPK